MKEIRAIVRPNRLERLRDALRAIPNFPGSRCFGPMASRRRPPSTSGLYGTS